MKNEYREAGFVDDDSDGHARGPHPASQGGYRRVTRRVNAARYERRVALRLENRPGPSLAQSGHPRGSLRRDLLLRHEQVDQRAQQAEPVLGVGTLVA